MAKIDYAKIYQKQIIEMATESKETLTVRKEIIIDSMSDEELGKWIRAMYKAKCESADEHINYIKNLKD
jgi:hypothetical protein